MKIGFFTQNSKKGGLDTFIIELLSHWPEGDDLILFCNNSHPGLENIKDKLSSFVEVIPYKLLIMQDLNVEYNSLNSIFRFILKLFFWFFGFYYQIYNINNLLKYQKLDKLLVINGGYPAGDACLASIIAWAEINPNRKAWHNLHNMVEPLPSNIIVRFKSKWIDKKISECVAGFVSVSKTCNDSITNRSVFHNINNKFIYNGISQFKPRQVINIKKELGIPSDSLILLMLAVYELRKGHHFMFQVMEKVIQEVPQAHLIVCGDGNENEVKVVDNLRNISTAAAQIHLRCHQQDIENLFSQTDIQVVPSQSYESFGYTALEAMACGIPVMATNTGGLKEVVLDGVCGYIIDFKNVDSFAKRTVELLLDVKLRKKMGKNGKKRYEQYFTAKRMARQYADLI